MSDSEVFGQAGLLQDGIRRVARLDLAIDRKMNAGVRGKPDVVITFTRPDKLTSGLSKQTFQLRSKVSPHY